MNIFNLYTKEEKVSLFCRQCCVGTELVDWLVLQSACVLTRSHAVGMWQALVEEGGLNHGNFNLTYYLFTLVSIV